MRIRKRTAFLMLLVYAVFLGIAVFHPISHSSHHYDDGQECPICRWLHCAAFVAFFEDIFCAAFYVVSFIVVFPGVHPIAAPLLADISRAPPKSGFYTI
jgi:hypothetical protein